MSVSDKAFRIAGSRDCFNLLKYLRKIELICLRSRLSFFVFFPCNAGKHIVVEVDCDAPETVVGQFRRKLRSEVYVAATIRKHSLDGLPRGC